MSHPCREFLIYSKYSASNGEETAKDEEMEHLEAPCALATSGKGSDDWDGEPVRSQLQEDLPPANGDGSEVPNPERHGNINFNCTCYSTCHSS